MATQTVYKERMDRGRHGMINNMVQHNVVTRSIESVGGIGAGVAACQGNNEQGATVGGILADFVGISVRDVTIINAAAPDVYPRYTNFNVLTFGELFITAPAGGVVAGDPVYFNATTGALLKAAGAGIEGPIVGARWKFDTAAGALAIVQLGVQR